MGSGRVERGGGGVRGENQVTGEGVDIPEGHLHGARRFCSRHHCRRHGDQGVACGGGGPDERIGILKFAFELLQIETQCARAILRQEPDLVIIFRLCKASVDAAGKDGSLAGLGSSTHLQLSSPVRQYIEKVPSLFISTLNKNKRKPPEKKKKNPLKKKKKKKKKKV